MCSAGSSVAINNARPSQAEIYAKAGVDLKDGKLPSPGDAAAKDKVVSRSSPLRVPRFCPVLSQRRARPSPVTCILCPSLLSVPSWTLHSCGRGPADAIRFAFAGTWFAARLAARWRRSGFQQRRIVALCRDSRDGCQSVGTHICSWIPKEGSHACMSCAQHPR